MERLTPFSVQLLEDGRHDYPDWKTFCIRAKNNCHLATVGQMDRFHEKDYGRIAYLMAAAPDLLEACKKLLHNAELMGLTVGVEQAKEAIAKASEWEMTEVLKGGK